MAERDQQINLLDVGNRQSTEHSILYTGQLYLYIYLNMRVGYNSKIVEFMIFTKSIKTQLKRQRPLAELSHRIVNMYDSMFS